MPATLTVFPRLFLLHSSLPIVHFSTMKSNPPLSFSRGISSSFCRLFPHKLKYQSFKFPLLPIQQQPISSTPRFSTRSAAGSKSLMDDEADLSDWVSGLSYKKTQVFSDSDGENRGGSRSGSFGRDKGSDRFTGREERSGGSRTGGFSNDRGSNRFTGREERSGGSRTGGFSKDRGSNRFPGREERSGGSRTGGFSKDRGSNRFTGREERSGGSRTDGFSKDRGSNWFTGREERSGGSRNGGFSKDRGSNDHYGGGDRNRNQGFARDVGNSKLRGGDEAGSKRRREDSFDDFGESRRRNVGERESFAKRNGRFDGKWGGSDEKRTLTRGNDRSNGSNSFGQQRGAESNARYSRSLNSNERFAKDGYKNERRMEQTKSSDTGYARNNGGKGVQPGKFMASDTEEDDKDDGEEDEKDEDVKGYKSFKDLINTEDDSEEVDENDSEEVDEDDMEEVDEDDDDVDDAEVDGSLFEKEAVVTETRTKKTLPSSPSATNDSYLTETRFEECSISPLSLKALKASGFEKMTVVQEATLPTILKGKDVLAKAKTGTGKTVAFLLPSIEVVVKSPPVMRDEKRPPIVVLIVCPTRELASQAASEANTLIKYHPSIGVQVVIGGTRLTLEQKRLQANPCQILVATPGRLKDHIENTAGFGTRLMGVKVLVLDEADHLLDMGFRKDIENIVAAVPKQRQTLLFSATVPEEVRHICHVALKRDYEYINTVQEGSEETHSQVRQTHIVAPLEKQFSLLYALLKDHIADDVDYKVLVFCTTAMVTKLVADLLGQLNLNVREIHSRKPQSYRTRVSEEFRKSTGLILVTSDVSARGVDYPDVSLVVQIGVPSDRQQYVHRLGRTGRKGKEGQGILMLAPWEEFFLSTVKDLPISKADLPLVDPETKKKVEKALANVEMKNKEAAYQAWLGYYNSNKTIGRDKIKLVELANDFSRSMGLDDPPAIPKLVLGKMGLKNIPGLRSK